MPVRLNQVKGLSEIRGLMSAFQGCGEPRVGGISHNPASCCFVLSSRASFLPASTTHAESKLRVTTAEPTRVAAGYRLGRTGELGFLGQLNEERICLRD
jgi:hypothetical protein